MDPDLRRSDHSRQISCPAPWHARRRRHAGPRARPHVAAARSTTNIKAVVLDEADEMLDLACRRARRYLDLPATCRRPLSATLPPKIARIAEARLVDPVRITIAKEKTAEGETPRVLQTSRRATTTARPRSAASRSEPLSSPSSSRAPAWRWTTTESLRARGFSARRGLTAVLTADPRPRREARPLRPDRRHQKTDVAARGIDLETLRTSSIFGIPASYETYAPHWPHGRLRRPHRHRHHYSRAARTSSPGCAIESITKRPHRSAPGCRPPRDVRARRLEMMRGSLAEILEAGDLDRFRVVVESPLRRVMTRLDVHAAMLKSGPENEGANDDDTEIPAYSPRASSPRTRR